MRSSSSNLVLVKVQGRLLAVSPTEAALPMFYGGWRFAVIEKAKEHYAEFSDKLTNYDSIFWLRKVWQRISDVEWDFQ